MERALKDKLRNGNFKSVLPKHRKIMQSVKSKGNKTTEARFRAGIVQAGIRGWKVNYKELTGCPDFFFPRQKVAVFVDGCFWHGCPKCGHVPKKNIQFWRAKILRNQQRDKETAIALEVRGIKVIRFWEHEIALSLGECINLVYNVLAHGKENKRTNGKKKI